MSAILVFILALFGPMLSSDPPESMGAPKPPCVGDVITVDGDQDTPCDVQPGQRLDVTNVTIAECADMGGEPIRVIIAVPTTCKDVDF